MSTQLTNLIHIVDKNVDNCQTKSVCEKCGKVFNHKCNYYTHKRKYCCVIKKNKLMDEYLETKYNLLKLEYEEKLDETKNNLENMIKKEIEDKNKFIEENNKLKEENSLIKVNLENKINELESKLNNQIIKKQNIQNIISNNNTNINNGIINIIHNYGEENISKLTVKDWEKIMSYEFDMIVKLIEQMHIITEENRNIFIPSLKEKYAMIMNNQKWNLVDRKNLINSIINNKNILLEEMIEKFGENFEEVEKKRSESIIRYCGTDDEEREKIKNDATLILFNNRELIRSTYEEKYGKKITTR